MKKILGTVSQEFKNQLPKEILQTLSEESKSRLPQPILGTVSQESKAEKSIEKTNQGYSLKKSSEVRNLAHFQTF